MKKIDFKENVVASTRHAFLGILSLSMCVFPLSACGESDVTEEPTGPSDQSDLTQLATPEVTVTDVTTDSATISWTEIEGAGSYQVVVTDAEGAAVYDETLEAVATATVENLTANTAYKAACTAIPSDTNLYSQSETGYAEFTTEEEEVVPQEQSFEITVSNVTSNTADVTVIPTIKDQYYRIIAFREDLPDDVVLDMIVNDVNLYVDAKGWDQSVEDGLFFIGDTVNCTFDQFPDGFDARFFVVGFDYVDGAAVATTPLFKSDKFTTEEIIESDAWVNMTPISDFVNGNLAIGVLFTPNESVKQIKAAAWNVYTEYGDPTTLAEAGYTEAGMRGALLSDSATDVDLENANFASYATPGSALLFGVIGIDETGTPGNTNWIIIKALDAEGNFSVLCQSENNESGITAEAPDMTIEYSFADATVSAPGSGYDGCPTIVMTFIPNDLCADYHFSVEDEGTFSAYGAYGTVTYLMDESNRWDPIFQSGWKDRNDTKDETGTVTDKAVHICMPYEKGVIKEILYVCIGEDGTPSEGRCLTVEIPTELSTVAATMQKKNASLRVAGYNFSSVMAASPRAHYGLK